jgi:hypothetical protein
MIRPGNPNSHKSRKLFLHEKTRLRAGATDRFVGEFSGHYQPMMEKAGARLFGIWEASSINSAWPEITTIWEIDNYKHLAQIGGGRQNDPAARKDYEQWMGLLGELDGHGEGRLVFGNPNIKTVAERKAEGFKATMVIEEIMITKPNGQTKYVDELEYLYVPWSEDTGKKWLGSFTTVFRYNEVIHYWACEGGWDVFANHFPSWGEVPDPRIRAWTNVAPALRDGWEDSFLQSLPPNPLG